MKNEKGEDIPMPAHARALLEPFVNIMNPRLEPPWPKVYLLTFIPDHDRPSDDQLKSIGRVTTTWSVLERVVRLLLARLAMAPDYPAMALTKDLGLDNQIKAIKTLLRLHLERYERRIVTPGLEDVIANMLSEFAQLKEKRNVLTHTVWFRMGEGLSGLRSRPTTFSGATEPSPNSNWTIPEIEGLADEIQKLADAMFVVTQILPDVDEGPHAISLSQRARHLPPGTQTKPGAPPRSSEG